MSSYGRLSVVTALLFFLASGRAAALTLDQQLDMIIDVYRLSPALCDIDQGLKDPEMASVGEVLFSTPVLSGYQDTSCATCHLDQRALTDGLPMAVGVGAEGEGEERLFW